MNRLIKFSKGYPWILGGTGAILVVIAYISISPGSTTQTDPAAKKSSAAGAKDAPTGAGLESSAASAVSGFWSWGGLSSEPKSNYDFIKLSASDLANPLTKANLYLECKDYLAESGNAENTYDVDEKTDPSGRRARFIKFLRDLSETRCEDVHESNFAEIDSLMAEAARNGEVTAKTYFLKKELKIFDDKMSKNFEAGVETDTNLSVLSDRRELLAQAETLALQGDLQAATIASRLTSSQEFARSMVWLMLGLQKQGQPFDIASLRPDEEPFSNLSAEDYQVSLEKAKTIFAALPH